MCATAPVAQNGEKGDEEEKREEEEECESEETGISDLSKIFPNPFLMFFSLLFSSRRSVFPPHFPRFFALPFALSF